MTSTALTAPKDVPPLYTDTPLALLTTPKYETGKVSMSRLAVEGVTPFFILYYS